MEQQAKDETDKAKQAQKKNVFNSAQTVYQKFLEEDKSKKLMKNGSEKPQTNHKPDVSA